MVTHSSILARRIPCTEEPGELQSMGVTKTPTQLSDQHLRHNSEENLKESTNKFLDPVNEFSKLQDQRSTQQNKDQYTIYLIYTGDKQSGVEV